LLEAIVALAIFIQHLNFELVPDQNISMTTGATIHTTNVMFFTSHARIFSHISPNSNVDKKYRIVSYNE
jgi:carotene epsilon-monooxygenase